MQYYSDVHFTKEDTKEEDPDLCHITTCDPDDEGEVQLYMHPNLARFFAVIGGKEAQNSR